MARRKMIPGKIPMWGVDVAVDWAEPEPNVDPEIMNKALFACSMALHDFFKLSYFSKMLLSSFCELFLLFFLVRSTQCYLSLRFSNILSFLLMQYRVQ